MTAQSFLNAYETALQHIEEMIDERSQHLDYENQGGLLTIFCPNGSHIIVSRQVPVQELWLAAKSGGFHFSQDEQGTWKSTRDDVHLKQRLAEVILQQSEEAIDFDL